MRSVREQYANGEIPEYYLLDLLDAAMEELHDCLGVFESYSRCSGADRDDIDFEEDTFDLKQAIKKLERGEMP